MLLQRVSLKERRVLGKPLNLIVLGDSTTQPPLPLLLQKTDDDYFFRRCNKPIPAKPEAANQIAAGTLQVVGSLLTAVGVVARALAACGASATTTPVARPPCIAARCSSAVKFCMLVLGSFFCAEAVLVVRSPVATMPAINITIATIFKFMEPPRQFAFKLSWFT
jgi:hypothetical protein